MDEKTLSKEQLTSKLEEIHINRTDAIAKIEDMKQNLKMAKATKLNIDGAIIVLQELLKTLEE